MKVLIAPDKFKGSLTAKAVGAAIAKGIQRYDESFEIEIHPLADGGDGSAEILASHLGLQKVIREVADPLMRPIIASYYRSKETAFVEMATASGLVLLEKRERNPLKTSTYGTGQLIVDAITNGIKKIYLFLGGSATNDGGMGIAHALGFKFLDKTGQVLIPNGEQLSKVHKIIPADNLNGVEIICLCDVQNTLLGTNGASYVYGPQKGANPNQIEQLELGMQRFAKQVTTLTGTDITRIEGGGAAGGIAAGLYGLINAQIQSGIDTILKLTSFESKLKKADLIISGEGKLDLQTLEGKVIHGVATLAQRHEKPLVLFVGQSDLEEQKLKDTAIKKVYQVMDRAEHLEEALTQAAKILEEQAFQYFSGLK